MDKSRLTHELKSAGAADTELDVLTELAESLTPLGSISRSEEVKQIRLQRLRPPAPTPRWRLIFGPALALSLVALITTVSGAQASTPGDPLYPVKLLTQRAAVAVNPGLRSQIVVDRSQDVVVAAQKTDDPTLLQETTHELTQDVGSSIDQSTAAKVIQNLQKAQTHAGNRGQEHLNKVVQDIEERVATESGQMNNSHSAKDNPGD